MIKTSIKNTKIDINQNNQQCSNEGKIKVV